MQELPITHSMAKAKWSYIYAYNLRTLRDIFVYCFMKGGITEEQLYDNMARNIIPPPTKQWVSSVTKRKERVRLEYIHAAEYLGLINRKQKIINADFENFEVEKKAIIEVNRTRAFKPSYASPDLVDAEKWALSNILFDYPRARDYLYWFLDFKKYKNVGRFKIHDFKNEAKPIFLLGKIIPAKKGSGTIKRGADGKLWKIPEKYIRLANSVFPNWFTELGLIDKVSAFPEFSRDKTLWHMFYPVKLLDSEFLSKDIGKLLEELFLKDTSKKSIWLPQLLYEVAVKYGCTTTAIKKALLKLYEEDYEHYYLERTSLSLMKRHRQYEGSYVKVGGFYRSSLVLTRGCDKNG
jgi:hypothetical protein